MSEKSWSLIREPNIFKTFITKTPGTLGKPNKFGILVFLNDLFTKIQVYMITYILYILDTYYYIFVMPVCIEGPFLLLYVDHMG